MAFNNEYPYVDPNRVNIDWVLGEIKRFAEEMVTYKNDIMELKNNLEEFKQEIIVKFDVELRELVAEQMEELTNSGYFDDLMTRYTCLSEPLNFRRKWRHIHTIGENNKIVVDDFPNVQGNCVFTYNNLKICAVIRTISLTPTNDGIICFYDWTTGNLLFSAELTVGHGNSLTFYNNKLYLLFGSLIIDGVNTQINKVCEIGFDLTHEVITTHIFDINYDGSLWGISNNGEDMFLYDSYSHEVVKVTNINSSTSKISVVRYTTLTAPSHFFRGFQDFEISNRYILILNLQATSLTFFDLTGNLYKNINMFRHVGHRYILGEPQGITLEDNGDLYLVSNGRLQHWSNLQDMIMQAFYTNIFTNVNYEWDSHDYGVQSWTMYCDANYTGNNPNGTQEKPFAKIGEALFLIEADNNFAQQYGIVLNSDFTNEFVNIYNKNVTINGTGAKHTIGGCQIIGSMVAFSNVNFTQSLSGKSSCLFINNQSLVSMYLCTFNPSNASDRFETQYGATFNASVGAVATDVSNADWQAEFGQDKRQYQINATSNVSYHLYE